MVAMQAGGDVPTARWSWPRARECGDPGEGGNGALAGGGGQTGGEHIEDPSRGEHDEDLGVGIFSYRSSGTAPEKKVIMGMSSTEKSGPSERAPAGR